MDDLKERLRTAVTYGYMPRRMREVADEAADRIAALEAQLAARDAEIAGWLRGEAKKRYASKGFKDQAYAVTMAAHDVESGAYKGGGA